MAEFLKHIPKAEVHVHLEGTVQPHTLLRLAEKNCFELGLSLAELEERRTKFANLGEFIAEYLQTCRVLHDSEDFYVILKEYLHRANSEGVKYSEVTICGALYPLVSFAVQMNGLLRAKQEIEDTCGTKVAFILCISRVHSIEENLRVFREAEPFKATIAGLGIAGPEIGNPADKYVQLVEEAKLLGLCGPDGKNITVHTGEEAGPTDVINTLYSLQPRRLDHGVRALHDKYLVKFLAAQKIPLAVSPLSNLSLKVLERFFEGRHVVKDLLDAGLVVCINSDDPAFYGGGVVDNFIAGIGDTIESQQEVVIQLCKNSFEASFLSREEKEQFCKLIDEFVASSAIELELQRK